MGGGRSCTRDAASLEEWPAPAVLGPGQHRRVCTLFLTGTQPAWAEQRRRWFPPVTHPFQVQETKTALAAVESSGDSQDLYRQHVGPLLEWLGGSQRDWTVHSPELLQFSVLVAHAGEPVARAPCSAQRGANLNF